MDEDAGQEEVPGGDEVEEKASGHGCHRASSKQH